MITQKQIDIIIEIMKPYNPKKIGIFGSFARGENSDNSDIDILYDFDFDDAVTLFTLAGIQEKLEKKLQKEVDLVPEKYIYPIIKESIMNDLRIIYEKN